MITVANVGRSTILVLALGLIVNSAGPRPAEAGEAPGPQVLRADQLTRQQFKRLPDSAVIEFKGQRMTKAQIRARAAQKAQEAMAKTQVAARQRLVQFEQVQARLHAENAKVQAELARLRQAHATPQARQVEAIEQEAAQLWQRSQRASPAERAQIEQRAAQLLQQLQQLGR